MKVESQLQLKMAESDLPWNEIFSSEIGDSWVLEGLLFVISQLRFAIG